MVSCRCRSVGSGRVGLSGRQPSPLSLARDDAWHPVAGTGPVSAPRRGASSRSPRSTARTARKSAAARDVVHAQDRARPRRPRARAPPASRRRARAGARPVIAPTKSLRETASRIGRPSARTASSRRSTATVCAGVLAKSGPGSSRICSSATPRATRAAIRSRRNAHDVGDDVVVAAGSSSVPFGSTRVCMITSAAPVRAHTVGQPRVAQPRDVVDDRRARRDRRLGHLRLVGVDGHQHAARGQRLDQRHHPLDLLPRRDRRPVAARGLAADVEDVRARRDQRPPAREARLGVRIVAPSENESGVALTMPISSGRPSSSPGAAGAQDHGIRRPCFLARHVAGLVDGATFSVNRPRL